MRATTPTISRRLTATATISLTLVAALAGRAYAQGATSTFVSGSRDIFVLDFGSLGPGGLPKGITVRNPYGPADYQDAAPDLISIVTKDGVPMLKAIKPVELKLQLPEALPDVFTLEFEITPKAGGGPEDLSFEGTASAGRSPTSMHVVWQTQSISAVGGCEQCYVQIANPLQDVVASQLTLIQASLQGKTFQLFTNGQPMFDPPLDKRNFVHGRILRVSLGGQDGGNYAVYLSKLRIAAGGGVAAVATQSAPASGGVATGTPPSGTIVNQPGSVSSAPRSVSTMPASGATTTGGQLPVPSGTPTVTLPTTPTNTTPTPVSAVPATTTGTITPMTGQTSTGAPASGPPTTGTVVSGSPSSTPRTVTAATTSSGPGATQTGCSSPTTTANTMTSSSTAGSTECPATYRVVMTGFAATKQTVDDPRDYDGVADEVYGVAAVVLWDRTKSTILDRRFVRTVEYGDIGTRPNQFGTRIKAGSASVTGGIWGGNGNEFVPSEFNPTSSTLPAPASDRFPLLLWEGTLTSGIHGLLVVPSLWESDMRSLAFDNYAASWKTGAINLLNTPAVQNQLSMSAVTSIVEPKDAALTIASTLTSVFTGGLVGNFGFMSTLLNANIDRPIGLSPGGNASNYQDRLVVITQEKLAALTVGQGITVAIPFIEPADGILNGLYTLYLRVERTQ